MSILRAVAWLAFVVSACAPDSGVVVQPELSSCTSEWSSLDLRGAVDDYAPERLRWHDAELYYPQFGPPARSVRTRCSWPCSG
jgi:hypothetical protein